MVVIGRKFQKKWIVTERDIVEKYPKIATFSKKRAYKLQ